MTIIEKARGAALATVVMMSVSGVSQAALVNFSMTGNVDYAEAGNAFGLLEPDTITATGVFDDAALSGGTGTVSFDAGSGNSLTITVGSVVLTEADDDLFGAGGASIGFFGGVPDDVNFAASFSEFSYFDSLFDFFDAQDDAGFLISGTWDVNSFSTSTAVPVPAAVWLFGSGLLGLVGVSRRGKKR